MNKLFNTEVYEINPLTMAVVASHDGDGKPATYVLEETAEYSSKYTPSKLVEEACKYFGSSLKGRQEGTFEICGLTHKAPISIEPASGMFFFPTFSPSSPKCSWIAHSHIDQIKQTKEGRVHIFFKNGKSIKLDVSFGSLKNQLQRTAQFRFLLENRVRFLNTQQDLLYQEEL